MKIFLTGANGFIGGAVASVLIAGGHKVRGLVRDNAKADAVSEHKEDAVSKRMTALVVALDEAECVPVVVDEILLSLVR